MIRIHAHADALGPDIVPNDERVERLPRLLVPHQSALPLVGDSHGG